MSTTYGTSLARRMSRKFQLSLALEGTMVGIFAGALVTGYRLSLHAAESWLDSAIDAMKINPALIPLWIAFVAIIMGVVARLMLWEPYTVGSGIPQIDAEVAGKVDMPWWRVVIAKFIEGTLCTFSGLSLGREGPAVQLGGMGGKAVSRLLKKARGEERILVTCGAGAGMAAAFHAPLTGIMFTIEEIHKVFTAPLIISVTISCIASDFLVSQVLGVQPVLSLKFAMDLPHNQYPLILLMGVVVGGLGALHNQGMFYVQKLYRHLDRHLPYSRLVIPFALSCVVIFVAPQLICGGDAIMDVLNNFAPKPLSLLVFLLIGKYLFTTICFGSGAPGGTLFPLVVMGSLAGAIFGTLAVNYTGLDSSYITNFMVLGIAGLFAGVVRAPVTGIVLAFELTGTLDSLLSAALVAIIAYVTANLCGVEPFYEKLLSDFLGKNPDDSGDCAGEKILHTHVIETCSFIEGKRIEEVKWPQGMLVITVERSGKPMLARGRVKLQAQDRLLVIEELDQEDACEKRLHSLCGGVIDRRL